MKTYTDKMPDRLLRYIREGKDINFYLSPEFRYWRARALERDNNECQVCKEEGKQSHGDIAHHIVHLKANPRLGLRLNNLLTVCHRHHNLLHPEKFGLHRSGGKGKSAEKTKKTKSAKENELPERWE